MTLECVFVCSRTISKLRSGPLGHLNRYLDEKKVGQIRQLEFNRLMLEFYKTGDQQSMNIFYALVLMNALWE